VISEILLLTSIKFILFFRDFEEDYSSGHVYDVIENHVGGSSGIVKIIFNHEDVYTAMQTRCRFHDTDITTPHRIPYRVLVVFTEESRWPGSHALPFFTVLRQKAI
jgi:hypothetical protein